VNRNLAGEVFPLILFLAISCSPVVALSQAGPENDDEYADTAADSTTQELGGLNHLIGLSEQAAEDSLTTTSISSDKFFQSWKKDPKASVRAEMRKVQYLAEFGNTIRMKAGSNVSENLLYSYETFRQQEKNIERPQSNVSLLCGQSSAFHHVL